jgi:hypothetical protein
MRVTSTGVGIGESSPLGKLHVKSADSGASADGSADELVIEGSGHSGLSILSGSSSYGAILFSDSESAAAGRLRYEHNNNALNFGTNGSWNRMYINSSGNVGIGDISPDTALHITRSNGSIIRLERNDTSIAANEVYGGIEFEGQDTDASSAGVRGKILGIAEGATGEFALTFETADSNGSSTEALRIDSNQNVGIGISPAAKLDVLAGGDQRLIFSTLGSDPFINAVNAANSSYRMLQLNGSEMRLMTGGSERARIDSSGRLFLGTSTVATANTAGDDFVIKGSGTAVGMTIAQDNANGTGSIFFGDPNSSSAGSIRYNHNTGDMALNVEDNLNISADKVGIATSSPFEKLSAKHH